MNNYHQKTSVIKYIYKNGFNKISEFISQFMELYKLYPLQS